ncbi:MAG TPA: hypothetical protein PLW83_03340 [Deltaproteobacteria bacterium]|nr:hypothetical protein [Deltaproteobacteria bacterium]
MAQRQDRPHRIETYPERCTGCLRCALRCSYIFTGRFNPCAARIRVRVEKDRCEIELGDACTGCGECAKACLYGALARVPEGEVL